MIIKFVLLIDTYEQKFETGHLTCKLLDLPQAL